MAEDNVRYLHSRLTEGQSKYAYFLLAAAAAGIALAMKETTGQALARDHAVLGLAVLSWALSFYFGCEYLAWVDATTRANMALLMLQAGSHPDSPAHPQAREAAMEGTRQAAEENAHQSRRLANRQFRFLVVGAVFYIIWHVIEMAVRTPALHERFPFL